MTHLTRSKGAACLWLALALLLTGCALGIGPQGAARPTAQPATLTPLERCQKLIELIAQPGLKELVTETRVNPDTASCEIKIKDGADNWLDLDFFLPDPPTATPQP